MTDVLLLGLRMGTVLALALVVLSLMRHRSASLRAWLLTVAIAAAALVPALELIAPGWGTPITSSTSDSGSDLLYRLLLAAWAIGAVVQLFVLVAGMVRLMGIAAAADPIREGPCADLALDISAASRVHAPVLLLEADHATLPVTWGHAQPKVLLPPAARHWSADRLRAVLGHEFAHVQRRDWLVHVFAIAVRSVYWCHPLMWVACARLRFECERACDDAVLASGVPAAHYASHLLDLARGFVDQRPPAYVSALIGRSTLERRVQAMLDAHTDRSPLRTWRRATIAMAMTVTAIAAAGFGSAVEIVSRPAPPPKRLTLLLDGRIVDLSKAWPTYPNPRAGLVEGPGIWAADRRP